MNRIVPVVAVSAGLAVALVLFTLGGARDAPEDAPEPAVSDGGAPPAESAPADRPAVPPRRDPPAAAPPTAVSRMPAETPPERGALRVDSDVPGAQVFIDRRFIGTTPVTAEDLTPGVHQLIVSAPGFDSVRETIDVEPGPRDLTVSLREIRLDAAIAVVHTHRFGSCTGRLLATPDGLRYETDHEEDAFSSPLTGLESFEVNYERRNLRVRLRQGREYTFTDPEENADRLFVFHRDVERARQRLTGGAQP